MILQAQNLIKENFFKESSLEIQEGEIINILSMSKDALDVFSKSLIGLIKIKGNIKLFGHNMKESLPKALNFIGYTSTLKYKSNGTVSNYLRLTAKFYKLNLDDRIDYLLDKFMIDKNKKMRDLNEFEQKDTSVIRALIHNPKFVILNNIVDTMDSKSLTILEDIIYEMKREGTSFLITSQKLAINNVDKVYVLDSKLIEYNNIKTAFKISFSKIESFNSAYLKNITLTNMHIGDGNISFVVWCNLNDTIKYLSSLKPAYLTISRPYIGEIIDEILSSKE